MMDDGTWNYFLLWTSLALGALLLFFRIFKKSSLPLPPGPRPLPFLGNILDMPITRDYMEFAKWGKKYGDVVHISVLGRHIIVLNSAEAANDLLDQRSAVYSDRPHIPMLQDPSLMNMSWAFTNKRYSRSWKRHRRLFIQHVNPTTITTVLSPGQISSVHQLLRSVLADSSRIHEHIQHAGSSIILGFAYGYETQPTDDPLVKVAKRAMDLIIEGLRPKWLVNVIPFLRHIPTWVPGVPFKKFAQECNKAGQDALNVPYEITKKKIAAGTASPSFMQVALSRVEQGDSDDSQLEQDVKEVAATMYGAGSDTLAAALQTLILQVTLHPEVQMRAQAELDSVLGSPESSSFRLPTFDDRNSLPYIEALCKEVLRWRPPASSGLPHGSMEEDEYRGWRIPKESVVIANTWGMLRDEKVYKDPEVFRPERFLGEDPELDPGDAGVFGFGRRVCPGRLLGENVVWLSCASLLACFRFGLAKDVKGNDIDIRYADTPSSGVILHPPPFPCSVTIRSDLVEKMIHETETFSA